MLHFKSSENCRKNVSSFHVGFGVVVFFFGIGVLNNMKHYLLNMYVANRAVQGIFILPIMTSLLCKPSI